MDRKRSTEGGRTAAKKITLFSIYFAVSLSDFKSVNIQKEESLPVHRCFSKRKWQTKRTKYKNRPEMKQKRRKVRFEMRKDGIL